MQVERERVLSSMQSISIIGYIVGVTFRHLCGQSLLAARLPGVLDTLTVKMAINGTCITCIVFFLASLLVGDILRRQQHKTVTSPTGQSISSDGVSLDAAAMAIETPPIVSLKWTLNYKGAVPQLIRLLLIQPEIWIYLLIFTVFTIACEVDVKGVVRLSPALVLRTTALDLLGIGSISIVAMLVSFFPTMRTNYRFSLAIERDGIVVGSEQGRYTIHFEKIKGVKQLLGSVYILQGTNALLIPNYVFSLREDRNAFVDTVDALRRRTEPPAHDWSSYL